MPVEIVLVRHGQSEGNRDKVFTGHGPSGLTELGRRQAEATGRVLGARKVDLIYSSDLVRCVETAAPLGRITGLRPVETTALRERDVGEFTGLAFQTVQARWPEGWRAMMARNEEYRPPGGESHRDCGDRVGGFLDGLLERHTSGLVVVFSHGVAINHMLRHALGLDTLERQMITRQPIGHEYAQQTFSRAYFQVENCSIQRFEHRADYRTYRILAVNDTAHLTRDDRTEV